MTAGSELVAGGSGGAELGAAAAPAGFGRGVNEYLGHYVTVSDAKAGFCVAAALGLLAYFFGERLEVARQSVTGQVAVLLLILSTAIGFVAIFPRLPKGAQGVLFWEDIRNHGTEGAYVDATRRLTDSKVEEAYARQNFHTAEVVHQKLVFVRWSVALMILGLAATMVALWGV